MLIDEFVTLLAAEEDNNRLELVVIAIVAFVMLLFSMRLFEQPGANVST